MTELAFCLNLKETKQKQVRAKAAWQRIGVSKHSIQIFPTVVAPYVGL